MPDPRSGDSKQDFLARCMGDREARSDFPDNAQRFAFCNSKWDNRQKRSKWANMFNRKS